MLAITAARAPTAPSRLARGQRARLAPQARNPTTATRHASLAKLARRRLAAKGPALLAMGSANTALPAPPCAQLRRPATRFLMKRGPLLRRAKAGTSVLVQWTHAHRAPIGPSRPTPVSRPARRAELAPWAHASRRPARRPQTRSVLSARPGRQGTARARHVRCVALEATLLLALASAPPSLQGAK